MGIQFGIILLVNGKDVPLTPQAVAGAAQDLKANGMQLELSERLELGSLEGGIDSLVQIFDNSFYLDKLQDKLPEPVDGVVAKLTDLELTIEEFKLVIPGTAITPKPPVSYTIGMSFMWGAGEEVMLIQEKIGIKGLFLRITSDESKPAAT